MVRPAVPALIESLFRTIKTDEAKTTRLPVNSSLIPIHLK